MTRLITRVAGVRAITDHETPYAAHHALVQQSLDIDHDLGVIKGTMSGTFTTLNGMTGSFILGELIK